MNATTTARAGLFAIALSALALTGCGDDAYRSTTADDALCGDGERIVVDETVLCVYEKNVVIETGFDCPSEAAHRFEHGDAVICSPDSQLSDEQRDRALGEYRDRHPRVRPDAGVDDDIGTPNEDTGDGGQCDGGDQDGDGVCAPDDCDDLDSAINPAAPEVDDSLDNDCDGEIDERGEGANGEACTSDADCKVDHACVEGVCLAR